jgi:IS1 family transposase/transposase-like protein
MIVASCQHAKVQKNGKTPKGATRFRCVLCGKSWTDDTATLGGMRIGMDKAAKIIEMLCEGVSASAAARLTGVDVHTVIDLMVYVGERCERFLSESIKNVFVGDVQVDEIWQFVFCKKATAKREKYVGGCGDSFCFTAIDRETKLLIAWHMGRRTEQHCDQFVRKLDAATHGHFHVSTDGFKSYPNTIRRCLQGRVDHGVMVKMYGRRIDDDMRRYSPAKIVGAARIPMLGTSYREQICTSHVERHNGSIRTFCKRMGRLTYCFSKRWDNHRAALAVLFCHYNWCRQHKTLKGHTPAMAHGFADHVWTVRELLEVALCK